MVIGDDGLPIAGASVNETVEIEASAARVAMVQKLAQKSSARLNLGEVKDLLLTTDKIYTLVRSIGDGTFMWSLIVTRAATLGTVRLMMNEYADQIVDGIPH